MTKKFNKRGRAIFAAEILLLLVLVLGCGENIDNVGDNDIIDNNNGNNVTEPHLTVITISPSGAVITDDAEQQYTAIGRYSDNTEKDITTKVAWNSADAAVAIITNAGLAKAATPVKSGTVDVSATLDGITGRVSLTVIDLAAPQSITVTPACTAIFHATEQQFTAIGRYAGNFGKDITSRVTWSSSDATVAAINASGLAMSSPTTTGTVEITAALGGAVARAELAVTDVWLPLSISITPVDPSIPYGTSIQFLAEGIFSDGSKQVMTSMVKWLSSDTTVAMRLDGLAKSTVKGSSITTISASFACISVKSALTVTNDDLISITIVPSYAMMGIYGSKQFSASGIFTDSSTRDITREAVWSSSDIAVASIDSTGLATSNFPGGIMGHTTISASLMAPLAVEAGQATLIVGIVD